MASPIDFAYLDMFPSFQAPNRSRKGKYTSRRDEETDSGTDSPSENRSLDRQPHFDDNFLHNRQVVILHTISEGTQASSYASDKMCDPKEGTVLQNNDVVVMGRYLETDQNLLLSYDKVCDIDQNLFTLGRNFVIKILKNPGPLVKLKLKANGFLLSVEKDSEKQTPASKCPKTLIEVEKLGTKLHFEQVTNSLHSEGTLTFFKVGEGHQNKKLFDVKMSIYSFPFCVILKESHFAVSNYSSGWRVVKEHKIDLVAVIGSDKDVDNIFAMSDNDPLVFVEIIISISETSLTEKIIQSLKPIKFELQWLTLEVLSPRDEKLMIVFLSKFPFCKNVRFEYFLHSFLNIKPLKSLQSVPKPSSEAFEQKNCTLSDGENFLRMIKSCYNLNNLRNLELSNFEAKMNSPQKIVHLREVLDKFAATRDNFLLTIRNPLIKAENEDITLAFLYLLTSRVTDKKERSFNEMATRTTSIMGNVNFSMLFANGHLNVLKVDLTAFSDFYKDIRELFFSWKLRYSVRVSFENFFLLHQGFNYTWMLQLNNQSAFDWLRIITEIGYCKLDRDIIKDAITLLSSTNPCEIRTNLTLPQVVIKIALSDSKNEMDELVSSFCKTLQNLGIEIKSLRIEVEADDSGWSFFKFTLTSRKTVVITNDVHIIFPFSSTENPRVIAIEVHTISKDLIQQVNEKNGLRDCELSPLVCIDQMKETPFLQPVSVLFRYPIKKENFKTSVYSKHPPDTVDWDLVQDYEIILLQNERRLLYQSYEFSPVISAFGTENGRITPVEYVNQYFANCAFVTILPLEHRIGNVVFDCLQEKNESEMKQLKVSRYFEKRKVGKMKSSQELFASLGKNLAVAEPELENGERLHFFCPDNVKNEQEYTMKKVDVGGSWRGYVHYFLKTEEKEEKLFHMCYQVPNEPVAALPMKDVANNHLRVEENITDQKRKYVEKALFKLCRGLQNPIPICTYLISEFEMTTIKAEEIRSQKTKHEKNLELVNHVLERGSTAYDKFRQALIEVEEPEHLIQLLPHFEKTPSQTDVDEPSESLLSLQIGEEIGDSGSG